MIAYDVKWPILYLFSKISQGYRHIELEDVPKITSFCMDTNTNTHLFWTSCNANVSQEQKYFLLFSFTTLTLYVWQNSFFFITYFLPLLDWWYLQSYQSCFQSLNSRGWIFVWKEFYFWYFVLKKNKSFCSFQSF